MNCLKDFIGIYGCRAEQPDSGLFINDLPGVSLQSIDKIADSDQQTYVNVWDDVQKRALRKMGADITMLFGKRYRIKSVADMVQLPRVVSDVTLSAPATELRGITIELCGENTSHAASGLQVIHVQQLEAYFTYPVSGLEFKVMDVATGLELDAFTRDVVAEWNTIAVNKDYFSQSVLIGYDATLVNSVELELPQQYACTCYILQDWGYDCCQGNVKGAVYDPALKETTQGKNSFGITGTIGVQCRYDALVCNNKAVFANALWYLLGAELMTERIYSDRLNRYTTVDRGRALELRNEFREEYYRQLEQAVNGITLNHNDCCVECAAQLGWEEVKL